MRLPRLISAFSAALLAALPAVAAATPQRGSGYGMPRDVSLEGHRIDYLINSVSIPIVLLFLIMVAWMVIAMVVHREGKHEQALEAIDRLVAEQADVHGRHSAEAAQAASAAEMWLLYPVCRTKERYTTSGRPNSAAYWSIFCRSFRLTGMLIKENFCRHSCRLTPILAKNSRSRSRPSA